MGIAVHLIFSLLRSSGAILSVRVSLCVVLAGPGPVECPTAAGDAAGLITPSAPFCKVEKREKELSVTMPV